VFVAFFIFISCNQHSPTQDQAHVFNELPIVQIKQLSEFDQAGDYYFQHLNYRTISLPDGDVILADRQGEFVIRVNQNGDFKELIARDGSGPGEVQDPMNISYDNDSSIIIYDQMRRAGIRHSLVSSQIQEFTLPQIESFQVSSLYPTSEENIIFASLKDFSFLTQPEKELESIFALYDIESDEILKHFEYPSETYASFMRDGRPAGGATMVPFTPTFLYDYSNDREEIYFYWTEDSHITVLNSVEMDTLRTIPVELVSEILTPEERDSLRENYREEFWPFVQELLPGQKTPADDLFIDHNDRIWLKLTIQSDYQEWIILDQNGVPFQRVQFPKEGRVTHISDQHIGFRADDHLFSLYELLE